MIRRSLKVGALVLLTALVACQRDTAPETTTLEEPFRTLVFLIYEHLGTGLRGTFFVPSTLVRDRRVWQQCGLDSLALLDLDGDGIPRNAHFSLDCQGSVQDSAVQVDFTLQGTFETRDNDSLYGDGWIHPVDTVRFSAHIRVGDVAWSDSGQVSPMDTLAGWTVGRPQYGANEIVIGEDSEGLRWELFFDRLVMQQMGVDVDSVKRTLYVYKDTTLISLDDFYQPLQEIDFQMGGHMLSVVRGDYKGDGGYEGGDFLFRVYTVNGPMRTRDAGAPYDGLVTLGVNDRAEGSDNENWRFVEGDPVVRDMIE